ncbi:DUF5719 family protein [Nocardioides limicola]|uniref:DUF5719 family protein n=1 Tax=Nocardioides limicola TaxID=2803368 RepID=UPI00193B5104|nr:DUF5719 family protein [Nocardioides sp. DJM-14]
MSRVGLPSLATGRRWLIPLLLPVLTLAGIAVAGGSGPPSPPDTAAESVPLSHRTLACPTADGGAEPAPAGPGLGPVTVANSAEAQGQVRALAAGEATAVELDGAALVSVGLDGPVVVRARGNLAPGLVAGRYAARGRARGAECVGPVADQWFTGVGAGAEHRSVVELINPDAGDAVADMTLLGSTGAIDAPRLRGVRVPGRTSTVIDLAATVPHREVLALRVEVSRGRLVTHVLDEHRPIGNREGSSDWLPGQAEPAPSNVLLGLPAGPGPRRLTVANPGEDRARVQVQVLTADSQFRPTGLEEIDVEAGSTVSVNVTTLVRDQVADGALGLVLTSTAPITATLASLAGGDRSHAVPAPAATRATVPLPDLPDLPASVVLTADARVVNATVISHGRQGRVLATEIVELDPGVAVSHRLPRRTRLVTVVTEEVAFFGAVLVGGRAGSLEQGHLVLPLRPERLRGLRPHMAPGVP